MHSPKLKWLSQSRQTTVRPTSTNCQFDNHPRQKREVVKTLVDRTLHIYEEEERGTGTLETALRNNGYTRKEIRRALCVKISNRTWTIYKERNDKLPESTVSKPYLNEHKPHKSAKDPKDSFSTLGA